jgi:hypothetical protein
MPGEYTIRLSTGPLVITRTVTVREDPRVEVTPAQRKAWTDTLLKLAEMVRAAGTMTDNATGAERAFAQELQTRLRTLYSAVSGATGELTADQRAQMEYFGRLLR